MNFQLCNYGSNTINEAPYRLDKESYQKKEVSRADKSSNWRQKEGIRGDQDKGPALSILQKDPCTKNPSSSLIGRGNKPQKASSILFDDIHEKPASPMLNIPSLRMEKLQSVYAVMESEESYDQKSPRAYIRDYHAALSKAVENKNKAKVYQIFNEMLQKWRPTSSTFSLLLTLCTRMRNEEDVPFILKLMEDHGVGYDASIYRTLLNLYVETKNVKRAYEVLDEMQKNEIFFCEITYNTIIKLHVSLDEKKEAVKTFSKMVENGIKPTVVTYRALFNLYLKDKKISPELFLEMKKCGVYQNEEVYEALKTYFQLVYHGNDAKLKIYNRLLHWCVNFKDKETFFRFYREMRASEIAPNFTTYKYLLMIALLNDLKTNKILNKTKEKFGELRGSEKMLPLEIYFILIEFHRVNKSDASEMNRYIDELVSCGIEADEVERKFDYFQKLLPEGGLERSMSDVQLDPFSYGQRLSVFVERKDESGALGVVADMEKKHVKITQGIIALLFKLYAIKRKEEGIDKVIAIMNKHNIKHDVYTYTSLLNVHVRNKNGTGVYKVLKEMEESGIEPNEVTYRLLIRFNCKVKNLENALRIIELMKKKGMIPEIWSYNGILSLCVKKGDKENFNKIFQEISDRGLKPNRFTYAYCIKWYFYNEEFEEAYKYINKFKSEFGTLSFRIYEFLINYFLNHNGQDWVDYYSQEMLANGFTEDQVDQIFEFANRP